MTRAEKSEHLGRRSGAAASFDISLVSGTRGPQSSTNSLADERLQHKGAGVEGCGSKGPQVAFSFPMGILVQIEEPRPQPTVPVQEPPPLSNATARAGKEQCSVVAPPQQALECSSNCLGSCITATRQSHRRYTARSHSP
eukprot:CAMPEP_0180417514 /NCGR_PEP_ID=MMETSP1036_2-20121128/1070_1 /TAXON_ID=632150 /ORGANISM="Azadinium spinosum, Strain 3D9" /LENGTH=139 /DNA_ID=CAMNT_0022422541 /DNA_START=229 /DNA_END=645 /DNA_ORIENTATION=+